VYQPNAQAWVEKIFAKHWDAIEERFGENYMPKREWSLRKGARPRIEEYGCGRYGCVVPTVMDDVVCKVTSDASEAALVVAYLELGQEHAESIPDGIVNYYDVCQLPETRYRRPVYLLLREEARNIGAMVSEQSAIEEYGDEYADEELYDADRSLHHVGWAASMLRQTVVSSKNKRQLLDRFYDPANAERIRQWVERAGAGKAVSRPTGAMKMGIAMVDIFAALEIMKSVVLTEAVAEAFQFFIDEGILLADVHAMNLGEPMPGERGWKKTKLIITDPGHMVPLSERWLEVRVPQLYE
jgi:hypothetical protein